MGINNSATPACRDILHNAVLQELAFSATGEADNIGMEFAYLRRNAKPGKEPARTCAA
jgi:hypothetical protein